MQALTRYGSYSFRPKVVIGNDVYIGRRFVLVAAERIDIADGVVISNNVYLGDCDHGFDPSAGLIMRQPLVVRGPILIGANCFIGTGSVILSGVTLGPWCVVGAGSVVTRSFPAGSRIGGAPARVLQSSLSSSR